MKWVGAIRNKTAEDRKRRRRENHATGRRSSPAAAFGVIWTCFVLCAARGRAATLENLRCEYLVNPLGVGEWRRGSPGR